MTILTPDFTHIIDFVTESISRDEDHILFDSTYISHFQRLWVRGKWSVTAKRYGIFGRRGVNILNLNGSDDVQLADYIKNNELHTLKR